MKYIVAAALFATALAAPGAPAGYSEGSWGTSTVEVTTEVTVTSCGSYVTDCPAGSSAPAPVPSSTAPAYGWSSAPAPVPSSTAPAYGWSSAPAPVPSSSEPCESPVPSSSAGWGYSSPPAPVSYSTPAAPVPSGSWPAPAPSYPAAGTSVAWPTGTLPAKPTASSYAPVPATGAGSSIKAGGVLAAAGALVAYFL